MTCCGEPEPTDCPMSVRATKIPRLLLVAQSSASLGSILSEIKAAGIDVTLALTPDSAVALCLGTHFAAVVLDACLIRNDDWTVARSLKLIKPALPIVLLDSRAQDRRENLPPDVDVLANSGKPSQVLCQIRKLIS